MRVTLSFSQWLPDKTFVSDRTRLPTAYLLTRNWLVPGNWLARNGLLWTRSLLASLLWTLLLVAAVPAFAVEPGERLANAPLEARARAISGELRCLVCQNESIDESGADLAHDIRIFLRERLSAGDTDAHAVQAVVNRYGAFVLLNPPVERATYVLWYGPLVLVAVGLAVTSLWLRRRQSGLADAAPLSAEESRRLDRLMREHDG